MSDKLDKDINNLKLALSLALFKLYEYEPKDSRMDSDEYVSMCLILCDGRDNEEALNIIKNGLNRYKEV